MHTAVSLARRRSILLAVLALAAVLLAGCDSPDPSARHHRAADTAAAAAPTVVPDAGTPAAAPAASPDPAIEAAAAPATSQTSPVEAAQIVAQAYRELTTRLFREIKPSDLLGAGWRGVRDDARRQNGMGAEQLQSFIDAGSGDIDGFAREFALFLTGPGMGLDASRLAQAAVRSMTASVGDSHTRYVPPSQAQLQEQGDGSYSGIGVETRQDGGPGLIIREVYGGSPADQAGLRPGERIVRVNGAEIGSRPQAEISGQIRGDAGTAVSLTLLDAGGVQRDVTLNRARILPPAVSGRLLDEGLGYLRVTQFPRRTPGRDPAAEFEALLTTLQSQGARGFVLDLRGNPGGDPFTSVDIASNFVQDGPIFVAIDRNGRRTSYAANKSRRLIKAPVVVLIDSGSASGAEVVASALAEYGAAYLVGTTTCGCLSVGQPMRLDDKSEIVITVQQALTGKLERSLEGRGLDPDEMVRTARPGEADTQLARALDVLKAKLQ